MPPQLRHNPELVPTGGMHMCGCNVKGQCVFHNNLNERDQSQASSKSRFETNLTKSDLVRAKMVLGSLSAALIMARAVLLSSDGMVASTTHRTKVSGLFRYLVTRAVVALA